MARDVRMSMSAHVTTMRRQERHQDETAEELPDFLKKLIIHSTRELKARNNVGIHDT